MTTVLLISVPDFLAVDATDAAPILAALSKGRILKRDGWQHDADWIESEEKPKVELLDESKLRPAEAPIKKLTEEKAAADKRWYEQYTATQAAIKERDEFKKQLAAIKEAATA